MTQRSFALDFNKLLIIIYIENSPRGISYFKYHHGSYFYRVAVYVIDLQGMTVKIADPQRNDRTAGKRNGGPEAAFPYTAAVFPEENDHPGLIGLYNRNAGGNSDRQQYKQYPDYNGSSSGLYKEENRGKHQQQSNQ